MKSEIRAEALEREGIRLIESTLIHDSEALLTIRGRALKSSATPTEVGCWNGKIIQPFEA